jgi:hypothetical protein
VQGETIHRAFCFDFAQGKEVYKTLDDVKLKQIRARFKSVQLIILEEISMISNMHLQIINARLHEIHPKADHDFGNICILFWLFHNLHSFVGDVDVILFGDLLQLPPVKYDFIFQPLSKRVCQQLFDGNILAPDVWSDIEYEEV